jgi:hypothetical protein
MMDAPVMAELVWHLARRGHPTLRFNWRGVGASAGTVRLPWLPAEIAVDDDVLAELDDDLTRAIDALAARDTGNAPIAIVGVSVGAIIAARVGAVHARVDRVVLVSPPVDVLPLHLDALWAAGVSVLVAVGDADTRAPIERVRALVGKHGSVLTIAGADHGFTRGLNALGTQVASWFPEGLHDDDDDGASKRTNRDFDVL